MQKTTRERAHAQPHDALVRWTFFQRPHILGLAKAALPAAWVASVDWGTFRVEKGSFVDKALRSRHSDVVVSVKRAGEDVFLHHSDTGWTAATAFQDIVAGKGPECEAIERHIPHFEMRLIDVSAGKTGGLMEEMLTALGRLVLWFLSVSHDDGRLMREIHRYGKALDEVLTGPNGLAALSALFEYLSATHRDMLEKKLSKLLMETTSPEAREVIVDFREELRIAGKLEGQAKMLLDLLAARFGEVPEAVKRRVRTADEQALSNWAVRVLTAATLEEVLDGEQPPAAPPRKTLRRG